MGSHVSCATCFPSHTSAPRTRPHSRTAQGSRPRTRAQLEGSETRRERDLLAGAAVAERHLGRLSEVVFHLPPPASQVSQRRAASPAESGGRDLELELLHAEGSLQHPPARRLVSTMPAPYQRHVRALSARVR
eukprot:1931437-Rhodomonas_salina.1